MKCKYLLMSSLAAFGIFAMTSQPANAQGFFNSALGFGGNTKAGDYRTISNNIQTSLASSASSINSAMASGLMNPSLASTLQARLNNLNALGASIGADGLYTTGEVQAFISEHQNLSSLISQSSINGNNYAGLPFGYGINQPIGGGLFNPFLTGTTNVNYPYNTNQANWLKKLNKNQLNNQIGNNNNCGANQLMNNNAFRANNQFRNGNQFLSNNPFRTNNNQFRNSNFNNNSELKRLMKKQNNKNHNRNNNRFDDDD